VRAGRVAVPGAQDARDGLDELAGLGAEAVDVPQGDELEDLLPLVFARH
jgi:hypothetical protein